MLCLRAFCRVVEFCVVLLCCFCSVLFCLVLFLCMCRCICKHADMHAGIVHQHIATSVYIYIHMQYVYSYTCIYGGHKLKGL